MIFSCIHLVWFYFRCNFIQFFVKRRTWKQSSTCVSWKTDVIDRLMLFKSVLFVSETKSTKAVPTNFKPTQCSLFPFYRSFLSIAPESKCSWKINLINNMNMVKRTRTELKITVKRNDFCFISKIGNGYLKKRDKAKSTTQLH